MVSWAPNIANGGLAEQQEHVVKRVCPGSYAKSAGQVQTAEKEPGNGAEHKGVDLQVITVRADIMERGENQRAEYGRCDAGEGTQAQHTLCSPGEETNNHDTEQELFVDPRAEGKHEQCRAAEAFCAGREAHGRWWRAEQQGGQNPYHDTKHEREGDRLEQHPAEDSWFEAAPPPLGTPTLGDEPGPDADETEHEQPWSPRANQPHEYGLQDDICPVPDRDPTATRRHAGC